MKVALLLPTLLATTTVAFPFLSSRHSENGDDSTGSYDWLGWFYGYNRPTDTGFYYGTPTPTPTPIYPTPGYPIYPTPTPTPSGSYEGGHYQPGDQENVIFYNFEDANGRTFYVYCTPRTLINAEEIGAEGGPFVCGA